MLGECTYLMDWSPRLVTMGINCQSLSLCGFTVLFVCRILHIHTYSDVEFTGAFAASPVDLTVIRIITR